MEEQNPQVQGNQQNEAPAQNVKKTFTQDEVNEIVRKRLAREKETAERSAGYGEAGRLAKELAMREQEIQRRERKIEAKERLAQDGLPLNAADLLHYDSEVAFEESLAAMKDLLGAKLQKTVEEMFREGGRTPVRSTDCAPAETDPLKEAFSPRE